MSDLSIDLSSLETKWQTRGSVCAVCGKDWERNDDDDDSGVPLLLWRKDGHEMLTLCWECATPRMNTPNQR